jgi:hypothetical protein
MFHNLLTDAGHSVIDMIIEEVMGMEEILQNRLFTGREEKDLSDQIDGKKYLVDNLNVDTNKVGYTVGHTADLLLMGMLVTPGEFKAEAAFTISD